MFEVLQTWPDYVTQKSAHLDVPLPHRVSQEVTAMLSAAVWLLLGSMLHTLRLSGSGGSFPKPLSAEEERRYLDRAAQGDLEARNILIERNLRLVAHIMKKG